MPLQWIHLPGAVRFAVLALMTAIAGCSASFPSSPDAHSRKVQEERYAKAKALFEERCKSAGVVLKRTVKDVEGIELIKVRPKLEWADMRYFDPMFDGAAMAGEAQGEGYIWSFLLSEYRANNYTDEQRGGLVRPERQVAPGDNPMRRGYRFVDVTAPANQQGVRYVMPWNPTARDYEGLSQQIASGTRPRYAVDYEDIVDPADRAYWVAGTRIKVIDQQTGEVIAQLTRFVWDSGFGVSTTGRWPWSHASSRVDQQCPYTLGDRSHITRYFVDTVLIPKQDE